MQSIPAMADEVDAVREVLVSNRDTLAVFVADGLEKYPHVNLDQDIAHVQALTQAADYLTHYAGSFR